MTHTWKRSLILILALILCISLAALPALAADDAAAEQPDFVPAVALEDESERLVGQPRFGGDTEIPDEAVPLAPAPAPAAPPNYGAILFGVVCLMEVITLTALLLLVKKMSEAS